MSENQIVMKLLLKTTNAPDLVVAKIAPAQTGRISKTKLSSRS